MPPADKAYKHVEVCGKSAVLSILITVDVFGVTGHADRVVPIMICYRVEDFRLMGVSIIALAPVKCGD